MGGIADAMVAYAQPLIDQTDGSLEEVNKAFALSTLCYNLALFPVDIREQSISEMRSDLKMDVEEFDGFRRSVVDPMIRRHQEMFPLMHQRDSGRSSQSGASPRAHSKTTAPAATHPGIDRYAPCPCNSGEKYKFCCGAKRR